MNISNMKAQQHSVLKGLAMLLLLVVGTVSTVNTAFAATARQWRTACDGSTSSAACLTLCADSANFGNSQWPGYCAANWCTVSTNFTNTS
ncbi:MAG: hypothetical protein EP312_08210, partial [Gammaproteobacteria bacterium]